MNNAPTPDDPPGLDEEVRRLLDLHRGHWLAIAEAASVSYSWLSKFSNGKITNPGYATLRRLARLLRERPPPITFEPPPSPPPSSSALSASIADALP